MLVIQVITTTMIKLGKNQVNREGDMTLNKCYRYQIFFTNTQDLCHLCQNRKIWKRAQ